MKECRVTFGMVHVTVVEDIESEADDPIVIPRDVIHDQAIPLFPLRILASTSNLFHAGSNGLNKTTNGVGRTERHDDREESILGEPLSASSNTIMSLRQSHNPNFEYDQDHKVRLLAERLTEAKWNSKQAHFPAQISKTPWYLPRTYLISQSCKKRTWQIE